MTGTVLVVPTRGRPHNAARLLDAAFETAAHQPRIVLAVDSDDPSLDEYASLVATRYAGAAAPLMVSRSPRRPRTSSHADGVNRAAAFAFGELGASVVIKLDDDHVPRTPGWDWALATAAGRWGMAWPNDGHPDHHLPTVCAMGAGVYRALGFMLPLAAMQHLFTDDYWLALGDGIAAAGYQPDILVEHMHAYLGKAPADEGYAHVNGELRWRRDGAAWRSYRRAGLLRRDIERVREAMAE